VFTILGGTPLSEIGRSSNCLPRRARSGFERRDVFELNAFSQAISPNVLILFCNTAIVQTPETDPVRLRLYGCKGNRNPRNGRSGIPLALRAGVDAIDR
jgi:hypothetical protein